MLHILVLMTISMLVPKYEIYVDQPLSFTIRIFYRVYLLIMKYILLTNFKKYYCFQLDKICHVFAGLSWFARLFS